MDEMTIVSKRTEALPAARLHPSRLFVEVTTRCNLRCEMCSKQAPGNGIIDGDMSDEIFDRLAPAFQNLDALILNGIGEPLLHPSLESFVERAKRLMPASGWIGFQTNGQLLNERRAESLVASAIDRICVSADAVSPEIFRMMRKGGDQEAVGTAVSAIRNASSKIGRKVSLGLEFVATRHNVHELLSLVRWASRNSVGFVIVTHMLPYYDKMNELIAFDINTDHALELFREWKEKAAQDGVDISRYFEVFTKFIKSPDEERIVDYVNRMTSDAWSRRVLLSVERLFKTDKELMQRVRDSFAEAEEIAKGSGMELHLPSLMPSRTRKCDFVEEGSAFVSWDGNVHPCYFLWHRYNCHLGGVVKYVKPESFGSVRDKDILSIWNGEAFSSFRNGVIKYDFPFCYDCNVALCDYVQLEEFTQDCYISTVPCGACLWCTGLFRCLQ